MPEKKEEGRGGLASMSCAAASPTWMLLGDDVEEEATEGLDVVCDECSVGVGVATNAFDDAFPAAPVRLMLSQA